MRDRPAIVLICITAALHLFVANRYDMFRDELYFIVCGRHPAFGYVDQPPLVPLIGAGLYSLGAQTWLLRLPSVLVAAGLVWLVIAFVRLFGGRDGAAWMAGIAAAFAPMFMGITATFNTTTFEPIAWTAIAYCLARAALLGDYRVLIWAGVIAGTALEAKYSLPAWLAALGLGLLLTPQRRLLGRPELWFGMLIAVVLAMPSIIWQATHGWPFAEIVRAAGAKNVHVPPLEFVVNQVLVMNPALAPLWAAGIVSPFALRDLRAARFLAIGFVAEFVLTIVTSGKDYYLAAAFPTAFALGAIAFEQAIPWVAVRVVYVAIVLAISAIGAPTALPLLDPDALVVFQSRTGSAPQAQEKGVQGTILPQVFADEMPWHALERSVADAYHALRASDRATVAIITNNYGEASALNVYGIADDLPPILSGHNQYYLWGTHGRTRPILRVNGTPERWAKLCPGSRVVARVKTPLAVPEERDIAIILCENPKPDILGDWASWTNYN